MLLSVTATFSRCLLELANVTQRHHCHPTVGTRHAAKRNIFPTCFSHETREFSYIVHSSLPPLFPPYLIEENDAPVRLLCSLPRRGRKPSPRPRPPAAGILFPPVFLLPPIIIQ